MLSSLILRARRTDAYTHLLLLTFLLNIADAAFSLYYISYLKVLDEANPLWESIIHTNPVSFFILKILMVTAGCFVLNLFKRTTMLKFGIVSCLLCYLFIVSWFINYAILHH